MRRHETRTRWCRQRLCTAWRRSCVYTYIYIYIYTFIYIYIERERYRDRYIEIESGYAVEASRIATVPRSELPGVRPGFEIVRLSVAKTLPTGMYVAYQLRQMQQTVLSRTIKQSTIIDTTAKIRSVFIISNRKKNKLSVSNPKSNYVAYLSVLSQISNCQGLGHKNKHEILKTDRNILIYYYPRLPAPVPVCFDVGIRRRLQNGVYICMCIYIYIYTHIHTVRRQLHCDGAEDVSNDCIINSIISVVAIRVSVMTTISIVIIMSSVSISAILVCQAVVSVPSQVYPAVSALSAPLQMYCFKTNRPVLRVLKLTPRQGTPMRVHKRPPDFYCRNMLQALLATLLQCTALYYAIPYYTIISYSFLFQR